MIFVLRQEDFHKRIFLSLIMDHFSACIIIRIYLYTTVNKISNRTSIPHNYFPSTVLASPKKYNKKSYTIKPARIAERLTRLSLSPPSHISYTPASHPSSKLSLSLSLSLCRSVDNYHRAPFYFHAAENSIIALCAFSSQRRAACRTPREII